jgi:hypothetical protein
VIKEIDLHWQGPLYRTPERLTCAPHHGKLPASFQ